MTYFRINEEVIKKCIKNLKLSKCPGPDQISPKILQMSVDSTSKALSLIFKRSLTIVWGHTSRLEKYKYNSYF